MLTRLRNNKDLSEAEIQLLLKKNFRTFTFERKEKILQLQHDYDVAVSLLTGSERSTDIFSKGTKVMLRNMRNNPELNGLLGRLTERDAITEQWQVLIDNSQEMDDETRGICKNLEPSFQVSVQKEQLQSKQIYRLKACSYYSDHYGSNFFSNVPNDFKEGNFIEARYGSKKRFYPGENHWCK